MDRTALICGFVLFVNSEKTDRHKIIDDRRLQEWRRFFVYLNMGKKILYESKNLILVTEFENVSLIDKNSHTEIFNLSVYGEVIYSSVEESENWIMIGAENLWVWKNHKLLKVEEVCWVHEIRKISENIVEILTDPWHTNAAVWKYDALNDSYFKVKDFTDYNNKPYSENVIW